MYGRRKYAKFRELIFRIHKIKIQPICWLITLMQIETYTYFLEIFLAWNGHHKLRWTKPNICEKSPIKAKNTSFRMFQNNDAFSLNLFIDIFHNFIEFHYWVSEIYITKRMDFALESPKPPNSIDFWLTIWECMILWCGP